MENWKSWKNSFPLFKTSRSSYEFLNNFPPEKTFIIDFFLLYHKESLYQNVANLLLQIQDFFKNLFLCLSWDEKEKKFTKTSKSLLRTRFIRHGTQNSSEVSEVRDRTEYCRTFHRKKWNFFYVNEHSCVLKRSKPNKTQTFFLFSISFYSFLHVLQSFVSSSSERWTNEWVTEKWEWVFVVVSSCCNRACVVCLFFYWNFSSINIILYIIIKSSRL